MDNGRSFHILLITYAFPPANMMAGHRAYLRAVGLSRAGHTVSVLTRDWAPGQSGLTSQETSSSQIRSEQLAGGIRVLRVPFGNGDPGSLSILTRLLIWAERNASNWICGNFLRNFGAIFCPQDYAFRLSFKLAELDACLPTFPQFVIASGDPWSNFGIGKILARRWGARFIAEYRDPWNYHDSQFAIEGLNTYNANPWSQFKRRVALGRERRLVHDADLIIAASDPFLTNAKEVTGNPNGVVITNAFDREEIESIPKHNPDKFTLTYVGSIYSQQRSDVFFSALDSAISDASIPAEDVVLLMIGSGKSHGFNQTMARIRTFPSISKVVRFTERIAKRECLALQRSSSILLFFAHNRSAGILPGKIFEYLAMGVPILLSPSDNGVLAELLLATRTGTICDSPEDTKVYLVAAYREWKSTGTIAFQPDQNEVSAYSIESITNKLCRELRRLAESKTHPAGRTA